MSRRKGKKEKSCSRSEKTIRKARSCLRLSPKVKPRREKTLKL